MCFQIVFYDTTGPTCKDYSNTFNHLFPGTGAFSRDFTKHLALQCGLLPVRAFTSALRFEKLKAPLFRGPSGAGDTNDWCITSIQL